MRYNPYRPNSIASSALFQGRKEAMARFSDSWVNREMINKEISIRETTLNNALQALKTRSIIVANPAQPGEFRLPTKSFAAWIKAFYMLKEDPFTS